MARGGLDVSGVANLSRRAEDEPSEVLGLATETGRDVAESRGRDGNSGLGPLIMKVASLGEDAELVGVADLGEAIGSDWMPFFSSIPSALLCFTTLALEGLLTCWSPSDIEPVWTTTVFKCFISRPGLAVGDLTADGSEVFIALGLFGARIFCCLGTLDATMMPATQMPMPILNRLVSKEDLKSVNSWNVKPPSNTSKIMNKQLMVGMICTAGKRAIAIAIERNWHAAIATQTTM